jgi:type VI protein secretion system component Hcp
MFSGKIKLQGTVQGEFGEFPIRDFKYSISKNIDAATGYSTGRVRHGLFEVDIDVMPKAVLILHSLLTNETLKGKITFMKPNISGNNAKFMEINIEKASCYSFEQVFSSVEAAPMVMKLKLSAQTGEFIAVDGGISVNYDNAYAVQ